MPSPHSLPRSGSAIRHFDRWGNFHAVGARGAHYGLIGHDSTDVAAWLADHPEFNGSIFFDYGNDEPEVDVTEVFFPELEDAA